MIHYVIDIFFFRWNIPLIFLNTEYSRTINGPGLYNNDVKKKYRTDSSSIMTDILLQF